MWEPWVSVAASGLPERQPWQTGAQENGFHLTAGPGNVGGNDVTSVTVRGGSDPLCAWSSSGQHGAPPPGHRGAVPETRRPFKARSGRAKAGSHQERPTSLRSRPMAWGVVPGPEAPVGEGDGRGAAPGNRIPHLHLHHSCLSDRSQRRSPRGTCSLPEATARAITRDGPIGTLVSSLQAGLDWPSTEERDAAEGEACKGWDSERRQPRPEPPLEHR